MTTKEALHELIDSLSDEAAAELLDFLNMQTDPDELTIDEAAEIAAIEADMRAGDHVKLDDLRAELRA